jgi:tryptophan-rich sensory protein
VWRRIGAAWALRLWGWQLLFNALWTPAFFGAHSTALGLIVTLPTLVLVLATTRAFLRISRLAGGMMVPYAAWTVYATYLNAGFWWLN